jgi:hypothetical protein
MTKLVRVVTLPLIVLLVGCGSTFAQERPVVVVLDAKGGVVGHFVPLGKPPADVAGTRFGVATPVTRKDMTLANGKIVSGFFVLGWQEADKTRVVVSAMVPRDGEPNVYLPPAERRRAAVRHELARFALNVGQSREVKEIKGLGADTITIRVDANAPKD